ncbi:MAG: hypothetical protein GY789_05630 [Hyphomicrobiales bacterium]|nr:hypothetical protein [Hyphomicrobiales bacterium]
MEIVEHDGHAPAWGADKRGRASAKPESTESETRNSLAFLCAAAAFALLVPAIYLLITGQVQVGLFAAAIAAILGFTVWLLDTEEEWRLW